MGRRNRVGPRGWPGWVEWCFLVALPVLVTACDDGVTDPVGSLDRGQAGRWTTGTLAGAGLDPTVLVELESRVGAGDFGEISSVLVLRDGVLVYERYWDGWTAADLHRVYSVTKSVTSLAIGIGIDGGSVPSLDTPILDILPVPNPLLDPAQKDEITLRHVLEMRAGFEWDELSTNYAEGVNPTRALAESPDWIEHVLNLPMAYAPGERFTYNSGVTMLLSGVLAESTGMAAEAFAADRLFDPLGITRWSWVTGPNNLTATGWGLSLEPRDMAAIGQMVLQRGMWDGTQVVPASWIDESALRVTEFTDGTGYGFQWWLGRTDAGRQTLAAWGWGGQFIVVIPSLDMVMVATGENFAGGGIDPYDLADFGYRAAGVAVPTG
jgi:CubicO group peptidase (beta-lactamase class C family)